MHETSSVFVEQTTPNYTSPLRKLKGVGVFEQHIRNILSRSATVPVLRCGGGDEVISADVYYNLLTRSTQIMREEYLEKMLTAKNEIENRCVILKNKKDDQMEELQLLNEEQTRNELATNAEQLAGKLETCQ